MEVLTILERQIDMNRNALKDNPEDEKLLMSYALGCLRRDYRLEALETLQKVLSMDPCLETRIEANFSLARIFALQEHYQEAYEELRKLFKEDPASVMGHLLLNFMVKSKEDAEVPEDMKPRLSFVPSRQALSGKISYLVSERELLAGEVKEYQQVAQASGEAEPILLYYIEEAKKRVARVEEVIAKCREWEKLAVDIPGFLPESARKEKAETTSSISSTKPEVDVSLLTPEDDSKEQKKDRKISDKVQKLREAKAAAERKKADRKLNAKLKREKKELAKQTSEKSDVQDFNEDLNTEELDNEVIKNSDEVEKLEVVNDDLVNEPIEETTEEVVLEKAEPVEEKTDLEDIVKDTKQKAEPVEETVKDSKLEDTAKAKSEDLPVKPAAGSSDALKAVKVVLKETSKYPDPALDAVLSSLCEARGVTGAALLSSKHSLISSQGSLKDNDYLKKLTPAVNSLRRLPSFTSWVVESKEGVVMLSALNEEVILIIDSTTTNVGVLGHTVKKFSSDITALL